MSMTNAQAALIAAASSAPRDTSTGPWIRERAAEFKVWLDAQDAADQQKALYGPSGTKPSW